MEGLSFPEGASWPLFIVTEMDETTQRGRVQREEGETVHADAVE